MTPHTFLFLGPQGCGKGTQIKLLKEYLIAQDASIPHFQSVTGDLAREFMKGDSPTQKEVKVRMERGNLLPLFIVIYLWADNMIKNFKNTEHLFMDGTPRKVGEAYAIDSLMEFYNREKPFVIFINLSPEESRKRLLLRARHDDNHEAINERLNAYIQHTLPVIEYYRNNKDYTFLEIKGDQSIEDVHKEIISKLGLA
jgi:adenylate kinase